MEILLTFKLGINICGQFHSVKYQRITTPIMYLNIMIFFCLVSIFIVALIPRVSSYYINVTGLLLSLILLVYNSIFIIIYNKAVNFQIFDCYSWLMLSNVMN